jgi:glycosyltransferase involved in cell wall biosynthesis
MDKKKSSIAPVLSICIPTYNRTDLLRRTLRSFEGGTPEVEVIICDNSDNDDSGRMAKEEMASFKGCWSYHKNEPPIGPIDNVNKGIKLSHGKFVYVLHDDDYLFPGGIATILEKLKEHPDKNVFSFGVKIVDINEKIIQVEAPKKETLLTPEMALYKTLSDSSYIRMPSIVIRRDSYNTVGFWDPQTAPPDDIDMFARLFMKYGLLKVPAVVAAYTVHEGAWTEKVFNKETIGILLKTYDKVESKNMLSHDEIKRAKAYFFHQFILGGTYRAIKKREFGKAKNILGLFKLKEIAALNPPLKWLPVRIVFKTFVDLILIFK